MEDDASIQRYRAAAQAYPELAAGVSRPSAQGAGASPPGDPDSTPAHGLFPAHYDVIDRIACTNISTTWKAFDRERSAHVVIKEPRARWLADREAEDRFRTEVRLASKLMHPNIVPILATHLAEPPWYFTMPFIEGRHLDQYCEQRRLSTPARLQLFLKVCAAVRYAHQHGVIHRDLKPNNILVCEDGEPQLLDFGLGRPMDGSASRSADEPPPMVMGTPAYMSPEQAGGLSGDTRTDVYALGVILYQLLTGRLPIVPAENLDEVLRRIREEPPVEPLSLNARLGRELNAILLKSLAKDPVDRYQGVGELARDIENYLNTKPVTAVAGRPGYAFGKLIRRNKLRVAASVVLLSGVLGVAVGWYTLRLHAANEVVATAERGRHELAVRTSLLHIREGDPANASASLWREFFRCETREYGKTRTRYALWELYRNYPCGCAVSTPERQVQVMFSPDGKWLIGVGHREDARLTLYDAADPRTCRVYEIGVDGRLDPVARTAMGGAVPDSGDGCIGAGRVCFSPRGNRLYVGCIDGHIRSWVFSSEAGEFGALVLDQPVVAGPVTAMAVSADEGWLAAGTDSGEVGLLESAQPTRRMTLAPEDGAMGEIRCLAFSPDNRSVACAAFPAPDPPPLRPGGIWLWAPRTGRQVGHYPATGCRNVMWSADGQELVFDGTDLPAGQATVWRWKPSAEAATKVASGFRWGIRSLDSPGHLAGRYLAIADGGGSIRFYDADRGEFCRIRGYHYDAVAEHVSVSFSPDGRSLVSAGPDGLRMWDFLPAHDIDLAVSKPEEMEEPWGIINFDVSPDKSLIAPLMSWRGAGQIERGSFLLGVQGLAGVESIAGVKSPRSIQGPVFSNDGTTLAFAEMAPHSTTLRTTVLLPPGEERMIAELNGQATMPPYWLEEGRSRWLLLGVRENDAPGACVKKGYLHACQVNTRSGTGPVESQPFAVFPSECSRVTSSPDGQWLAACCEQNGGRSAAEAGRVRVWQRVPGESLDGQPLADSYRLFARFSSTENATWSVALVKDRKGDLLVATSGADVAIRLWQPETGACVGMLQGHRDAVRACVALDEHTLVTASDDQTVRIWDVLEQEEVCVLYRSHRVTPTIAVHGGCIAIADGTTVTIADTAEIPRLIERNRDFEKGRPASEP